MKKLLSPVLLLLLLNATATAQQTKLLDIYGFGTDKSDQIDKHVVKTDDGGCIIRISSVLFTAGNLPDCHNGVSFYQRLFRKYDATGSFQWERCYSPATSQTDTADLYIFPAGNGNFYTIAIHGVPGGWPKYMLTYEDAAQNKIWMADSAFGGAQGLSLETVCRSDDGGFYLAFWSYYTGGDITVHYGSTQGQDIWVLKLDSLGNREWSRIVGGTGTDAPTRILPATNGGCYLVGYSGSNNFDATGNNGWYDYYIARMDNAGNILWHKCLGGSDNDLAYDACDNGNGGVLIAGGARSVDGYVHNNHQAFYADYWLVNIDSSGTVIWDNCFGSHVYDEAYAVCRSTDGSIWLTGYSKGQSGQVDTNHGNNDAWIVRADSNGNFLSAKVLGANKQDDGKLIHPLQNGVVLVGGEYSGAGPVGGEFPSYDLDPSFPDTDIFLARLAPWTTSVQDKRAGNIKCRIYPNPAEQTIYIEMQETGNKAYSVQLTGPGGETFYKGSIGAQERLVIPAQQLARGSYYLIIKNASRQHTEKIILQ